MQAVLVTSLSRPVDRIMSSGFRHDPVAGRPQVDANVLLERVATQRDRDAFAGLFRFFAPRLKGFFRKRGLNDAGCEELVQDVMLTIWRRADSFDPARAAANTWVYTIARNRWIDNFRRENRPRLDPDDPMLRGETEPTPDEALSAARQDGRVREAMAGLPAEQLTLVRMSFFEDKPHSEIARELDIPLGTVKSRIRLAMRRLRGALGEDA